MAGSHFFFLQIIQFIWNYEYFLIQAGMIITYEEDVHEGIKMISHFFR